MKCLKRIIISFSFLLKPLTIADRILIVLLLVLSAGSLFFVSLLQTQGETVQIFRNNELKYQFKLNEDKEIAVETGSGSIQIFIKDKKVWVNDSTCPAKICKKMGKISKTGQNIVCVPNKVFIQIVGKNNQKYIDVITE